jgi:hypothetical protein
MSYGSRRGYGGGLEQRVSKSLSVDCRVDLLFLQFSVQCKMFSFLEYELTHYHIIIVAVA